METNKKNDISLEKWAEKILKTRDMYDNVYVFPIDPSDFKEEIERKKRQFSSDIKRIEQAYQNRTTPNPILSADLITQVARLLINIAQYSDDKEFLIEVLRFYKVSENIFKETHAKSFVPYQEGERIGMFVFGLKLFGSSINQAKKSVSEWTKKSLKTVEGHYTRFNKLNLETSPSSFILEHDIELAQLFIDYQTHNFPSTNIKNSVNKTQNAFLNLKKALVEHFKAPEYEAMVPFKPLRIHIDWDSIEKIRQELLTLA